MRMAMPVFDRDLALQRAGGSLDLAQELFAMLVRDLPDFLRQVETTPIGNATTLVEVVHKLNGAATYCGVPALKSAAHLYETALKMGHTSNFEELHFQLLQELRRVIIASRDAPPF